MADIQYVKTYPLYIPFQKEALLRPPQGPKLEGYKLNLKHFPRDNGNGPHLMGWDRYDAILLRLGRDRMPKKGSN